MSLLIRPFTTADLDALYALWGAALGASWPLSPRYLARMTSGYPRYREGSHLVAERDGQVVGFVATQTDAAGHQAGIPLLMVSPQHQRRGIGRRLHDAAVECLRQRGVAAIHLAHGGGDYFWPGVPLNLPGAVEFFRSCGWDFLYTNYDLTRDLSDYQAPPGVLERAAGRGVVIRPSTAEQAAAVVDFERRVFPSWAEYYQITAEAGRPADILAAWDGTAVIGSLLLGKGDVAGLGAEAVWHQILGADMGTIGAVGVAKTRQGQGIGLALVAVASDILKARGVRQCHIGWTSLLDFYGKLGYTMWRAYAVAGSLR